MTNKIQDPKITKYVLNEMNDAEKADFEKQLDNDTQKVISEIGLVAEILEDEFRKESMPATHVEIENSSGWMKKFFYIAMPIGVTAGLAFMVMRPNLSRFSQTPTDLKQPGTDDVVKKNRQIIEKIEKLAEREVVEGDKVVKNIPSKKVSQKPAEGRAQKPAKTPKSTVIAKQDVQRFELKKEQKFYDSNDAIAEGVASSASPSAPARLDGKSSQARTRGRIAVGKKMAKMKSQPVAKFKAKRRNMMVADNFATSAVVAQEEAVMIMPPTPTPPVKPNNESYGKIVENIFKKVEKEPLSTFSIDVDTASYSNMRRFLNNHQLPPANAVRIEEMVNYFNYDYKPPTGKHPFAVHTELTNSPWNKDHKLLRIGLKGREIAWKDRKNSNIVFLLDVSGSMRSANKLPLVKQGIKLLVDKLGKNDRIAIAVYAGASGLVLPSTPASDKEEILAAIDRLNAGGSTNGGAGIQLAYKVAQQNFIKGGVNRVILATDGDFNVGVTNNNALVNLIKEKAKSDVFLTVLGFGSGNYKDDRMESLANKGNGNYAYIDSYKEAKKVLVEQAGGTLVTIAKDVKIQVEFNPARVSGYRLLGYENRMLNKEDFNDDKKDAGEIGAGHTVTALYEIVPTGVAFPTPKVDELKYQKPKAKPRIQSNKNSEEWLTVKLRYKQPTGKKSTRFDVPLKGAVKSFPSASKDMKFASAVAGFGMLLRDSQHSGTATFDSIKEMAVEGKGDDEKGYRSEFIRLIDRAKKLKSGN